jgi:hypothetical protein
VFAEELRRGRNCCFGWGGLCERKIVAIEKWEEKN